MQENVINVKSPVITNTNNNNLKELKIVLNRDECLIKTEDVKMSIGTSKCELENNQGTMELGEVVKIDACELMEPSKLSKIDAKSMTDSDDTNSEASEKLNTNNKRDTAYSCEVCSDTFQTPRALSLHSRFHVKSNGVIFKCALCRDSFETNDELINHKLVHASEDRCFKCKKCKLAFTNHHDYVQHNAKHIKTPLYKCIECSYTFHLRKSYKSHISMHYLKQLKCNLCQEPFTQKKDLARHKIRYHQQGIDCVECGKNCPTRRDHVEHMTKHTGVKVFQCLYCGECFSKHGGSRVHTRKMHTKFIPHECTVCSERFHSSPELKSHMITHETKKKYECNDCGKQVFHRMSMVQHTRLHMNYMLYKCPVCKQSYTTYQNLKSHVDTAHVKVRRYKCELCKISFVRKTALNKHFTTIYHRNNAYAAHLRSMSDEK